MPCQTDMERRSNYMAADKNDTQTGLPKDTVTVEDVAALAFKIAQEVWSEEEIRQKFGLTEGPPGTSETDTLTSRKRQKKPA